MRVCAHVHVQEPEEARASALLELEDQVLVRAGCSAGNQTSTFARRQMLPSHLHHPNENKRTKK